MRKNFLITLGFININLKCEIHQTNMDILVGGARIPWRESLVLTYQEKKE